MTKEAMIQILYKALADGVAKLIKNGLAFTVMTAAIGGLVWLSIYLVDTHEADRRQWKSERMEEKAEYAEIIDELRAEVDECNAQRALLSVRVAELEAAFKFRKR